MKIQRLNMDNSWHIWFGGQSILIAPWLQGVEVDYFSWFNKQWHRTPPVPPSEVSGFDLVIITQKYPDHFHKETLQVLQPQRLIVPKSIYKAVRKLLPEAQVWNFGEVEDLDFKTSLKIHFLPTKRKMDPIYDGLVLEDGKTSILLATHGFSEAEPWVPKVENLPPLKLAITPFNTYKLPAFLGGTVSPGLDAVRYLIQTLKPEKVVATHDEDKHAKGLVSKLARITVAPSGEKLRQDHLFKDRLLEIKDYREVHI